MKKTIRVDINGLIFQIAEDAYFTLRHYLDDIEKKFARSKDGREIVNDIESRISELLREKTDDRMRIVNLVDVEEIIAVLGEPGEFNGEEPRQESQTYSAGPHKRKRIYRDPDNEVLAGVCAGIAAYFGIEPIIVRIIFIALVIIGAGAIVLLYLLLWIAIPKAETTAQKLEMRGAPVNLSSIEMSVKEEFEEVKRQFKNLTKGKTYTSTKESVNEAVTSFGYILGAIGRGLLKFIGVLLIISGLVAFTAVIFSVIFGVEILQHEYILDKFQPAYLVSTVIGSTLDYYLALFGLLIVFIVPVILILYAGIKAVFRFHSTRRYIWSGSLGLWLFGILILVGVGLNNIHKFKSYGSVEYKNPLEIKGDTLLIKTNDFHQLEAYDAIENFELDGIKLTEKKLEPVMYGEPKFNIRQSSDSNTYLIVMKDSRGKNWRDASKNADYIEYTWKKTNGNLLLDRYFVLKENGYWRNQHVQVFLEVPKNKVLYFDNSLSNIMTDIDNTHHYWHHQMLDKYWRMKKEGLSLAEESDSTGVSEVAAE